MVIKTVLPHLADAEYVARFRDEAKVVVKLSHGNLVPVFDAGLEPGRDVALASFDDTPLSSEVSPAVTSVDHHAAELAEHAVRLLFERADDPSRDWQRITVPGTLAVRESTQLRP